MVLKFKNASKNQNQLLHIRTLLMQFLLRFLEKNSIFVSYFKNSILN